MSEIVMERKASDNKYLHRDFHVSADIGIAYVGDKFGDGAVKEYLTRFALSYYKPLFGEYEKKGLIALKEWIEDTYKKEESPDAVETSLEEDCLSVNVKYCPAVKFMKEQGHTPSKWYRETTQTVNKTIADKCGLSFEMGAYDEETGKTTYKFKKI